MQPFLNLKTFKPPVNSLKRSLKLFGFHSVQICVFPHLWNFSHPWRQLPPNTCFGQLTNPVEPLKGETPYWENVSIFLFFCINSWGILWFKNKFQEVCWLEETMEQGVIRPKTIRKLTTWANVCFSKAEDVNIWYLMTHHCSEFNQSPSISSQCFSISLNTQETQNSGLCIPKHIS